jgi:hypothetical protein
LQSCCKKTVAIFLVLSHVCPEPVLVNCSFSDRNGFKRPLSYLCQRGVLSRPAVTTAPSKPRASSSL